MSVVTNVSSGRLSGRRAMVESLEVRRLLTAIMVDDDLQQCPDAEFTSIQAAVLAAAPGDTVHVCPGLYNEAVMVTKPLTLSGTLRATAESRCDDPEPADPTRDSIVQSLSPVGTFNLSANDIVLEDFVVQNSTDGTGIYTSPLFSGYQISGNLVQNNVFGLYFNSSGARESVVRDNCFRRNNASGSASGNGIYTDQGLHNAVISSNSFHGNVNSAIVIESVPGVSAVSEVTIEKNTSVEDGSLVAVFNSSDVEVAHNRAERSQGSSIFVGNNNAGLKIHHNRLSGGNFHGIRFNALGLGPVTGVNVSHNDIRNFARSGISVAPNSLINSLISQNRSTDNGQDGIRIDAGGNGGNLISQNLMLGNDEHDAHDDTVGAGTAGTANVWVHNNCQTENRPGLCKTKK